MSWGVRLKLTLMPFGLHYLVRVLNIVRILDGYDCSADEVISKSVVVVDIHDQR